MRVKKLAQLLSVFASIAVVALTPLASAFSGNGLGTSGNPYRIAHCSQLSDIDDDLDGFYVLARDINCDGVSFTHLAESASFTGTLDGQGYRIMNITIDNYGLFRQTNGAVIKNIYMESATLNLATASSFVNQATATQLINLHSNAQITTSGAYAGGLVSAMIGPSTMYNSSFSGTLSASASYAGGLVGRMLNSTTALYDSYFAGSITSGGVYAGAIVGAFFDGTIENVYSTGNFNVNSNNYNGGLIGDAQGTIGSSFAATTLTNRTLSTGGVIGLNNAGAFNDLFFDSYLAGTSNCYGANDVGSCTTANASNAAPNYFKNNSTNGPFANWDFTDVWQTTTGYPELRSKSLFDLPVIPNGGEDDANGDEVGDVTQWNVLNVLGLDGLYVTIEIPEDNLCSLYDGVSINAVGTKNDTLANHQLPNLTGFSVYCPSAGLTVPVTLIYNKVYDTSKSVLRYYNQNTQEYSTVSGAVFSTRIVNGVNRTIVTYNLTDGGANDSDGVANRVMIDPVGFATLLPVSGQSLADTGTSTYMYVAVSATMILAGTFVLRSSKSVARR